MTTDSGWIKLHRAIITDPVWTTATSDQKAVLVAILLSASYEHRQWAWEGKKFAVNPGQFVTSLSSLATSAGVSIQSVRSAIARFEKLNFLTNTSTKTGRLISIVKWDTYQGVCEDPNKAANKEPTKAQQLSIIKEEKIKEKELSPDALRLSDLLANLIEDNNPKNRTIQSKARQKSIARWARDIDKLLGLDGREPQEIEEVIRWSQGNDFWLTNILSGTKLRKQFDQITLQMQSAGKSAASVGNKTVTSQRQDPSMGYV